MESAAAAKLIELFSAAGWTIEPLKNDYGEDFLVRIFENEIATPLSFYIQSKATKNLNRHRNSSGKLIVRVSIEHAIHWLRFREPVLLTLFDVNSGVTHWQFIHLCEEQPRIHQLKAANRKTVGITLPDSNRLNSKQISRIKALVSKRFDEYAAFEEGVTVVTEVLKDELGFELEYDPIEGCLVFPTGSFVPSGGLEIVAFGRMYRRIDRLARMAGIPHDEILPTAIKYYHDVLLAFEEGSELQVRNSDDAIIERFTSLEEFSATIGGDDPLDDDD